MLIDPGQVINVNGIGLISKIKYHNESTARSTAFFNKFR